MQKIYKQLLKEGINKDNILLDEPMCLHTSFKVGGKVDIFIKAYSLEEIKSVLKIVKENNTPLFILGNGTNLLVKDEGYRGIALQIKLEDIQINGIAPSDISPYVKEIVFDRLYDDIPSTGYGKIEKIIYKK